MVDRAGRMSVAELIRQALEEPPYEPPAGVGVLHTAKGNAAGCASMLAEGDTPRALAEVVWEGLGVAWVECFRARRVRGTGTAPHRVRGLVTLFGCSAGFALTAEKKGRVRESLRMAIPAGV
ncbi:MAG: hypothetical protein LBJ02_02210 [Bifidobacteriaceae bacterium]|jgi:hypothetical protein|nr:hypothetical protein [Bifidobacteriaceae bacterium]